MARDPARGLRRLRMSDAGGEARVIHSTSMLSRRNWAAALASAPCILSCLPLDELASYSSSRGDAGREALGPGSALGNTPPRTAPEAGLPGRVNGQVSGGVDASAPDPEPDGGGAPGGSPDSSELADAASDAAGPVDVPTCGVSEVTAPNGNCYLAREALASWADARSTCQARGAGWDLASITSSEETEFWAPRLTFEAWVGASDAADEGTWVWISDGTPFWSGDGLTGNPVSAAYTNWNSDEPNGGENSDCGRLLPRTLALPDRDALWADLECVELLGSICEGPPQ